MVEKIKKTIERITLWVMNAVGFLVANPQIAIVIAGVAFGLILTVALYWTFHQTDSDNEKKAEKDRVETIRSDAEANQAVKRLKTRD
jgi:hypothetical protein